MAISKTLNSKDFKQRQIIHRSFPYLTRNALQNTVSYILYYLTTEYREQVKTDFVVVVPLSVGFILLMVGMG